MQSVSNEVGCIYAWRREYIQEGASAIMNPPKERSTEKLIGGEPASLRKLEALNAKIQYAV